MKLTIKEVEDFIEIIKWMNPDGTFPEDSYYGENLYQMAPKLAAQILKDQEALREAREYFDDLYDADCDQDGFIPNKEMTLLVEIEAALLPKE